MASLAAFIMVFMLHVLCNFVEPNLIGGDTIKVGDVFTSREIQCWSSFEDSQAPMTSCSSSSTTAHWIHLGSVVTQFLVFFLSGSLYSFF